MVEEGDLDDKLEDKATNEVVDDVKKVAMEGVDKERKQVAMKVANTNCLDDLIDPCHPCLPCHPCQLVTLVTKTQTSQHFALGNHYLAHNHSSSGVGD